MLLYLSPRMVQIFTSSGMVRIIIPITMDGAIFTSSGMVNVIVSITKDSANIYIIWDGKYNHIYHHGGCKHLHHMGWQV